jgi:hypothetical protein
MNIHHRGNLKCDKPQYIEFAHQFGTSHRNPCSVVGDEALKEIRPSIFMNLIHVQKATL